jgi:hypothetical protein
MHAAKTADCEAATAGELREAREWSVLPDIIEERFGERAAMRIGGSGAVDTISIGTKTMDTQLAARSIGATSNAPDRGWATP